MRLAVVSGDGLAVSGLLTTMRNLVELARLEGLVHGTVPIDFGFSWRPDKESYFPRPSADLVGLPEWLEPSYVVPYESADVAAQSFGRIRQAFANDAWVEWQDGLRRQHQQLVAAYSGYFTRWFEANRPDWVIAMNMTLTDASAVTEALYASVDDAVSTGLMRGGLVIWDHDLFGSYAVTEAGERVYPERPTRRVPLPRRSDKWIVVSERLRIEAQSYGADAQPVFAPSVLPALNEQPSELAARFLEEHQIPKGAAIHLVPARVFPVKGIEISIRCFARLAEMYEREALDDPILIIFGARDEDLHYGRSLTRLVRELGLEKRVLFADGVPLSSHTTASGSVRLNEIDLLSVANSHNGGVIFTPAVPDVESVGLGPALAAIAKLPCLRTAFGEVGEFSYDRLGHAAFVADDTPGEEAACAAYFRQCIDSNGSSDGGAGQLEVARQIVRREFSATTWLKVLNDMRRQIGEEGECA